MNILKRRPESIDQLVSEYEMGRRARESSEKQRRLDFSKTLGEKAMKGEPFGVAGFLAIGFPTLPRESYPEILRACAAVRRFKTGTILQVDKGQTAQTATIGLKGDGGDRGLRFSVIPQVDGSYHAEADVVCSKALYMGRSADKATMHGTSEESYGLKFIDSSLRSRVKPVIEVIPAHLNPSSEYDSYPNGDRAYTDEYTQRLLSAAEASTGLAE